MTATSVSDASAYRTGAMIQIASAVQPAAAASAFIAIEMPTHATFSTRGRTARLPCRARRIIQRENND